jgi:hypothetical protein
LNVVGKGVAGGGLSFAFFGFSVYDSTPFPTVIQKLFGSFHFVMPF